MKAKSDNYEKITNTFVDALQAVVDGTTSRLPWQRDWSTLGGMRNGFSGRSYSGINIWLLAMRGFNDPRWATRKQIMTHCGYTKGAGRFGKWIDEDGNAAPKDIFPEYDAKDSSCKATTVVFWKFIERQQTDEDGNAILDEDGSPKMTKIPLLKTFNLFNFDQISWPESKAPESLDTDAPSIDPSTAYEEAEKVFAAYIAAQGISVTHGGDRAYYNCIQDYIRLPRVERFLTAKGYQRTKAHELVHSTGAPNRLDRDMRNRFGSENYAREELVAELGAAFLGSDLGFSNEGELDDHHKAYLLNWIERLKDNKYEIFTAARLAREAVAMVKDGATSVETVEEEQIAA